MNRTGHYAHLVTLPRALCPLSLVETGAQQ